MRRVLPALLIAIAITATVVVPVAAADAPGTCSGATANSAQGTWLTDSLSSATDVDWFRFTTTKSQFVLLTLGKLPANYRLDLYSSCSTLIASSNQGGTIFEELYRSLPMGAYRVRVSRATSTWSTTAYWLKFRSVPSRVQVLSAGWWVDKYGYLHIPGEILNSTNIRRRFVKVTATYYNSSNVVVGTDFTYADRAILGGFQRSPFHLLSDAPVGFHHFKLAVSSDTTTATALGRLAHSPGVAYTDAYGYRHYPGEVRNGNTFTARFVEVLLTLYTSTGSVLNTDFTYTDPYNLAAGATAPYEFLLSDHYVGANRATFVVQADR